jgi:hypothetical protein
MVKGALLFELWTAQRYRPTREADFLSKGENSPERYQRSSKRFATAKSRTMFILATEADAKEAQLKKEADDARKAAEADHKAVSTAAETFKASYPGTLHFDYTWDQKKGAALGIEQILRDDKFTYLRGRFQEPANPAACTRGYLLLCRELLLPTKAQALS